MPNSLIFDGRVDFLDVSLWYNHSVLTPRLETEALVLGVARFFSNRESPEIIIDVGTGSGAIAISLYARFQLAEFYATDISESALQVAQSNAVHNTVPIMFLRGNLLDGVLESGVLKNLMHRRVLIVANLPYIGEDEEIGEDVRLEDPPIALYGGGTDGFDCIRNLLEQSKEIVGIAKTVHVALEFWHLQLPLVAAWAKKHAYHIQSWPDYSDISRFAIIEYGNR